MSKERLRQRQQEMKRRKHATRRTNHKWQFQGGGFVCVKCGAAMKGDSLYQPMYKSRMAA